MVIGNVDEGIEVSPPIVVVHMIIVTIDNDFVMTMAVVVVVMVIVRRAGNVYVVVTPIDHDLTVAMTVVRGATGKTIVREEMGECATADVRDLVRCTNTDTGVNCAAMHVDIVVVSVDDNLVVMAFPIMIVTLAVRYVHHTHVEIEVIVVVVREPRFPVETVVRLIPHFALVRTHEVKYCDS